MICYKPSKYNLLTYDLDGNILLANTLKNSFLKIVGNNQKHIVRLLNQNRIEKESVEKYPFLQKYHFVVEEDMDEKKIADLRYNELVYSNNILELTIIPTDACNFRCRYCYQEGRINHIMTEETAGRILLFIKRNCRFYKGVNINWFGGEPLLEKDFVIRFMREAEKICRDAKVPLTGSMSTNGYLLDQDSFQELIKHKVIYFQITIDGTKESHNFQRPHMTDDDSYQKIIDNLKRISQNVRGFYKITIRVNITKSIEKCLDDVIENFRFLANNSRFRIHWQFVRDFGGEQVHKMEDEIVADFNKINGFIDAATENNIASLYEIYFGIGAGLCAACKNHSFILDQDGRVFKCTLAIYDEKVKDNCIGCIDEKGNMVIEEYKNAGWILRESIASKCENCFCYPICFHQSCPYSRRYKNEDGCFSEKNRLSYFLRNMSRRNLIDIIEI